MTNVLRAGFRFARFAPLARDVTDQRRDGLSTSTAKNRHANIVSRSLPYLLERTCHPPTPLRTTPSSTSPPTSRTTKTHPAHPWGQLISPIELSRRRCPPVVHGGVATKSRPARAAERPDLPPRVDAAQANIIARTDARHLGNAARTSPRRGLKVVARVTSVVRVVVHGPRTME